MTPFRKITPDDIKAMAHEAAEHQTPLADANHFTPWSDGWILFEHTYLAREAELHLQRQVEEVA